MKFQIGYSKCLKKNRWIRLIPHGNYKNYNGYYHLTQYHDKTINYQGLPLMKIIYQIKFKSNEH